MPRRLEAILATASEYLAAKKEETLLRIVVNSRYSVQEEWSHDNWDGGTWGHALTFHVPRALFPELIGKTAELGLRLRELINEIKGVHHEFVEEIFFEVEAGATGDWRAASGAVVAHDKTGAVLAVGEDESPWVPGHLRIFLSHPSSSKVAANQLKQELLLYGFSAFVAHEDIEPTAIWQREIERALASMHSLVALGVPGFRASHWCQQEVGWALGRGVPILGLRAGEDPPGFIGQAQALPANLDRLASAAREVAKLLAKEPRTATIVRGILVSKITTLENWEGLRDLIECLIVSPGASSEQLDSLEGALKTSDHLRTSRSLPQLTSFIAHHRSTGR